MFRYRLKRPKLCFLWTLPLLVALGMDTYIWLNSGVKFHFAEIGYLLQHYLPEYHDQLVDFYDAPFWLSFLSLILNAKAALIGLIMALLAILWINRRPYRVQPPSVRGFHR